MVARAEGGKVLKVKRGDGILNVLRREATESREKKKVVYRQFLFSRCSKHT